MAVPPRKRSSPLPVASAANDDAVPVPVTAAAVAAKPVRAKAKKSVKAAPAGEAGNTRHAKFTVGSVVCHRVYPFRGVVYDIDPVFNNTEEWWQSIPEEIRPRKDQPFYHLLAENSETTYEAYVSEQNLLADKTGQPVRHPKVKEMFASDGNGQYKPKFLQSH